jgi:hypothetical protein
MGFTGGVPAKQSGFTSRYEIQRLFRGRAMDLQVIKLPWWWQAWGHLLPNAGIFLTVKHQKRRMLLNRLFGLFAHLRIVDILAVTSCVNCL